MTNKKIDLQTAIDFFENRIVCFEKEDVQQIKEITLKKLKEERIADDEIKEWFRKYMIRNPYENTKEWLHYVNEIIGEYKKFIKGELL